MTGDRQNGSDSAVRIALAIVVVALIAVIGFFEIVVGSPLSEAWYLLAVGGVWAMVLLVLWRVRRRTFPLAFGGATTILLVLLLVVPWTSRKPFLRALGEVEVGMVPDQVHALMEPYQQGRRQVDGVEDRTSATWREVYRHDDGPRFGGDRGIIDYRDGRVAEVRFLPD